jgi:ferric-dicitrate binding protein FerR (iron transport regulator)
MDNELLQRYIEGNATEEEIATVVNRLDTDEDYADEYRRLHKLYCISLFHTPAQRPPASGKTVQPRIRRAVYELLKITAIFCLAWAGLQLKDALRTETPTLPAAHQTLFVPAGQRAELSLPDGSRVWLNAQSSLSYPSRFEEGNRIVTLDGEAYFSVEPDSAHPFTVKTKRLDVQVLGTEFCVVAYKDSPVSEVSLLKGSVALKPAHTAQTLIMKANEHIRLEGNTLHTSTIADYDRFRWREGLICFHNETVGSIFEKLELYFGVKINVQKKPILKYRYSGKFRTKDGVEQVLKVLQLEQHFTYTRDGELNVITVK